MIFNGIDLEQHFGDDFIVKDVRGRTITQNELETLSIPLANGEILIDSKIPPKVLEVDIALNANTKRDLNKKIDELNSIIHTKETVPIILKDEPDMTYYGILGTSKEDPEEANVHEATLNIMVLDGLKYGPLREIKVVRNLLGTDGDFSHDSNGDGIANIFTTKIIGTNPALENGVQWFNKTSTDTRGQGAYFNKNYGKGTYLILVDVELIGDNARAQLNINGNPNHGNNSVYTNINKTIYYNINLSLQENFVIGLFNVTPNGHTTNVGFSKLRVYEIDEETNSKIDSDPEYTGDKLVEKFPYIEPPQTMFLQSGLKETITYAGTAPVIPEVEIIPSEKTTYAGYTNGEKSVLVGYPIDVETMPYDKEPIIWNKVLIDQTGWIDATTIPNGVATGHILATKDGFVPADFGTGDGWHGPSMIYTLNEALDDFEISVYTHVFNDVAELGKIEWNLLTQDGVVLSRFEFGDFWNTEKRMVGNAWIGEIGFQEGRTIGAERGMQWNGFKGVTRIRKVGNVFEFYIARVTKEQGHHQISKVLYVDTNNLFNNRVAKIQVTFAAYKNYPSPHVMRIPQIIVRKINPDKEDMIPYIAEVGEKITIDKSLNVYRDGEKRLGLNVFSKPIQLQKGENNFTVLPPNADVTVRFREVFK